ncbi:hypothetical protein BD779DRAFT_1558971 [Infundibulicybe gibba]|nr:hypothetical protein BD779DRAFT_1558971 [Infundibulicybe gibba]
MTPPNGSPEMDNPHSSAQATAAHLPLAQPTLKRPASRSPTPSNRQPINPAELQAQLNTQTEFIAPAEQQLRDEQDAIQKPPIYSPSPTLPPASDVVPRLKLEGIEALLRDERELRTKAEADKQIAIARLRNISQQGIVAQMGRLDAESKHRNAENALAHERDLRIQAERGLHDMRAVLEGDRQLRIEAEQRLAGEQRSRITAEQNLAGTKDELRHERQLRTQAESCLTDIERECRHPFVVPAMLSAFKIVSALTSQQVIPKS